MFSDKPFQDYFPGNVCQCCGPSNFFGMRMKSFWRDKKMEETICVWQPRSRFSAATRQTLHGGTSGSLIDCNGVWLAIADRYRRENRRFGDLPIDWWYVSRDFNTSLKHAVPTDKGPLTVITRVLRVEGRKTFTESKVSLGDMELVAGTTLSVAIPITGDYLNSITRTPPVWYLIKAFSSFGFIHP